MFRPPTVSSSRLSIEERTGKRAKRNSWSDCFYEGSQPSLLDLFLFARAFEPSARDLQRMIRVYVFGEEPPEGAGVSRKYEKLAADLKEAAGGALRFPPSLLRLYALQDVEEEAEQSDNEPHVPLEMAKASSASSPTSPIGSPA